MDFKVIQQLVQKFKSQRPKSHVDHGSSSWPKYPSDLSTKNDMTELPSRTSDSIECLQNNKNNSAADKNHEKAENRVVEPLIHEELKNNLNTNFEKCNQNRNNIDEEIGVARKQKDNVAYQLNSLLVRLHRLEVRLLQVTRIQSLADLIRQLHMAFDSNRMEVDRVQFLMESYVSNVEDWEPYAQFNEER